MEFIFLLIFIIWIVIAFVASSSPGRVVQDPGRLAQKLPSLARSGRDDKVVQLLNELPGWPIRDWLVSAAIRLGELRRSVALAEPAGVSPEITSTVREHVGRHQQTVWEIAVRVAALAQQTGAPKFKKLPPDAVQWVNRDEQMLINIAVAAYETRESLTPAIAKGQRQQELEQHDMTTELRALGTAVRKLSNLE